jgi:hypothetical protein
MKSRAFYALLGVALAAPAAAFAGQADHSQQSGHYEWKSAPQYGPRATGSAQRRVWVPDTTQVASCDCDMMKMSSTDAADCMKRMHSMGSPSAPSAG